MNLLSVENLQVSFGKLQAVRGISFTVDAGESVGIVGESASGKSAVVQAIMGLSRGTVTGQILSPKIHEIGMVFQDPMSALNPTMKIGEQIIEGFLYHKLGTRTDATKKAIELLSIVGVDHPEKRLKQYPHHLSGGQRQRALIAMALICHPKLLIADEPTTALDAITRASILDLLKNMKDLFQMSLLLISHDFSVVASSCEKILVMYAGKIVEQGYTKQILALPQHPYTKLLLDSLPMNRAKHEPLIGIDGSPPNLLEPIIGCAFRERCPYAALKCKEEPTGQVACWRAP